MDSIVIAKAAVIERCIKRIHEEYGGDGKELENNYTKQDSIILNLERLVQATIDMGSHVVKEKGLGHVTTYREIFDVLGKSRYPSERSSPAAQKNGRLSKYRHSRIPDHGYGNRQKHH